MRREEEEEGMEAGWPAGVMCLPASPSLTACLTVLRDRHSPRGDFIFHSEWQVGGRKGAPVHDANVSSQAAARMVVHR